MDMTDRRAFLSMASMAAMAQAAAAETALSPGTQSKEIRRQPLPEPFTGWEARFVEVNFPMGVRLVAHKHPSFVLGYVTEGEFRFGLNDETPSFLAAGQAFYEPTGANHTAGDSANSQRAARILAIIIAPVVKK
jgi:quercetin dioxygenase-like cupin family protein